MHVAVCVVGFRNGNDIESCLHALARSSYRDFEVIICENGGASAFTQLQGRLQRTLFNGQPVSLFLAPRNLGYAGGVNLCVQQSRGADAWWVLNPDTLPEPDALRELVLEMGQGRAQVIGGLVLSDPDVVGAYGGRWRAWLARAEAIGLGSRTSELIDRSAVECDLSYIPGCSMLISRAFIEKVGLMREDYFLYGEEVEWCLRGVAEGMKLGFTPSARVHHKLGTTTGAGGEIRNRRKLAIYLDERNKILITRDRYPARLPFAALSALALIFLRYGRHRAWRQLGYALQGWAMGLANQRGVPRSLRPELGLD